MKSLTRNLISAVVIINFISPINGYDIFSTKRLEASQNTKIFRSKDIKFLIQKAEEAEESNSWEKAIEIRKRIIKLIKVPDKIIIEKRKAMTFIRKKSKFVLFGISLNNFIF